MNSSYDDNVSTTSDTSTSSYAIEASNTTGKIIEENSDRIEEKEEEWICVDP